MNHRIYKTESLILRRSDMGEADRLLLLATPLGKKRVIAKGVRKTTSRIAGHIELFVHTTMMLAAGRNLDVVTQSQVLQYFNTIRTDLSRLSCAYYAAELYDACTQEEDGQQQLFTLLIHTFKALDETQQPEIVLRGFELRLLEEIGYRPHLHHCVVCEAMLTEEADRFSPTLGGVVCPNHRQVDTQAIPMSLNTFKLLRYLQQQPYETIERLRISSSTRTEIESVIRSYLHHILERKFKTVAFMEYLRGSDVSLTDSCTTTTTHDTKEMHHVVH